MHKHTVVAYFSATGTTERVAKKLAEATGATLYEIKPAQPYTAADLNWNDPHSRSSQEAHDPAARPALAGKLPDLSSCTCLFLGFPVWWDQPPAVILSFSIRRISEAKPLSPLSPPEAARWSLPPQKSDSTARILKLSQAADSAPLCQVQP